MAQIRKSKSDTRNFKLIPSRNEIADEKKFEGKYKDKDVLVNKEQFIGVKKQDIEDITSQLYDINATISLRFIGMNKKVKKKDVIAINHTIAEIIQQLRWLAGR